MEMDAWLGQVPAVLLSWYSGMEGGNAIARVVFGDVNPSGKLPATFPKRLADSPAHTGGVKSFPGENGTTTYSEGVFVGYRWFDTKNIEPLFAFGHGLSYTTFKYSNFNVVRSGDANNPTATVEFEITNTGKRAGAEVVQLYVQDVKASVARPAKELKGFQKVMLQPGETKTVSVSLDRSAFAFFDEKRGAWVAEAGEFKVLVGASGRDIRLTGGFSLDQNITWKE